VSDQLLSLANEVLKAHDKDIHKLCDAAVPVHA
jgi:hypothetical protein